MKKIAFSSLKTKINTEIRTFNFNDNKIEVLQYLPLEQKYNMINNVLNRSKEEKGTWSGLKIDSLLHLSLVYYYTNITFTDKQKEDESKIYDNLKCSGLLDLVISNMDEKEYNEILYFLDEQLKYDKDYIQSFLAFVDRILIDAPKEAAATQEILKQLDMSKLNQINNILQFEQGQE